LYLLIFLMDGFAMKAKRTSKQMIPSRKLL
jgi:hypothetical protein